MMKLIYGMQNTGQVYTMDCKLSCFCMAVHSKTKIYLYKTVLLGTVWRILTHIYICFAIKMCLLIVL